MGEFDYSADAINRVLAATLFVAAFGMVVSQWVLNNVAASILVTLTKALLFAACYVAFYDTFNGQARPDDLVYLRQGASLLDQLRTRPWSEISLIHTAESFHFFYLVPVALALWLFGEHYHSMVALNVALSFICAALAYAIVNRRYKDARIARPFFILIALSPDLLSWTSFFAGKDTWVLLGHLIFIYAFVCIEEGKRKTGMLWAGIGVLLTINLRFYVPVFMLGLIALTIGRRTRFWVLALVATALVLLPDTVRALSSLIRGGIGGLSIDLFRVAIAVPRFWLTPRPFLHDELHGFLLLPSMINWTLLPLILIGLYRSSLAKDRFARFMVLYFMAFSLFYGVTDVLNGPRQRLQLLFAQTFFLWVGLGYVKLLPTRLRIGPSVTPARGAPAAAPPDIAPAY